MKSFLQKMSAFVLGIILATGGLLQAQDYYWIENFDALETYTFIEGSDAFEVPSGWMQYDVDGNTLVDQVIPAVPQGYGWTVIDEAALGGDTGAFGVAASATYFTTVETANDWLVSPAIEIPSAGYTFEWRSKSQDDDYLDDYEVYVSTGGNTQADVTALVGTDALVFATPPDPEGGPTGIGEPNEWTVHNIDLTPYAGETVHLIFRNVSEDEFYLLIDYVGVLNPPTGIDAVLGGVEVPIEYSIMHRADVTPIGPFGASFNNYSDQELVNATVTAYIDSIDADGNLFPVWSSSTEIASVAALEAVEATIEETFTPTNIGFYALYYEISHDGIETEGNTDNNFSEFYTFFVDETNYERAAWFLDVPGITAFYSPFDDLDTGDISAVGAFGTVYEFSQFADLDSIGIFVYQPNGPITCDVFTFDPVTNTVGELVGTSETWDAFGEGGEEGFNKTLAMSSPVALAPGHYFFSANDTENSSLNIIYYNFYNTENRSFVSQDGGEWLPFNGAPDIWVVATSSNIASMIVDIEYEASGLTYDFTGSANGFVEEWFWDFGDGTTATGQTSTHTFVEGTYDVCLSGTIPGGTMLEAYCETITIECSIDVEVTESSNSASIEIEGGLEPYTIVWTDANGNPFDEEGNVIEGLEEGVDYSVMVIDANGCSTSVPFSTVECNLAIGEPEVNENNGNVSFTDSVESGQDAGDLIFYWEDAIGDDIGTGPVAFGLEAGDYTLVIEDANGCTTEVTFTVPEPPIDTNIEELSWVKSLEIAPNPATTHVNLTVELTSVKSLNYTIFNVEGKRLLFKDFGQVNAINENIDVSTLSNGIYILQVEMNKEVHIQKLVINK